MQFVKFSILVVSTDYLAWGLENPPNVEFAIIANL